MIRYPVYQHLQSDLLPCFYRESQKLQRHLIHQDLIRLFRYFSIYNLYKTMLIMILRIIPHFHVALQKFRISDFICDSHAGSAFFDQWMVFQLLILFPRQIFKRSMAVSTGLTHCLSLKALHSSQPNGKDNRKKHRRQSNGKCCDDISCFVCTKALV